MAKSFIEIAKIRPRHHLLKNEPWSLWCRYQKLTKNLSSTIYDIVHSEEARSYWITKEKTEGHLVDYVAMKSTELTKGIFITKHTVGMCGVEKFMKIWKQRESEKFPRCDEPEEAPHVWKCQSGRSP
jgi:hypothetical protein